MNETNDYQTITTNETNRSKPRRRSKVPRRKLMNRRKRRNPRAIAALAAIRATRAAAKAAGAAKATEGQSAETEGSIQTPSADGQSSSKPRDIIQNFTVHVVYSDHEESCVTEPDAPTKHALHGSHYVPSLTSRPLIEVGDCSSEDQNDPPVQDFVELSCSSIEDKITRPCNEDVDPLSDADQNIEVHSYKELNHPLLSLRQRITPESVLHKVGRRHPLMKILMPTSDGGSCVKVSLSTVGSDQENTVPTPACELNPERLTFPVKEVKTSTLTSPQVSSLLERVKLGVLQFLPNQWEVITRTNGISVCRVSQSPTIVVIQRSLVVETTGKVHAAVHGKIIHVDDVICDQIVPLTEETVDTFTKEVLRLLGGLRSLEICRGIEEFRSIWNTVPDSEIDSNKFLELRYQAACRPTSCHMVVPSMRHKRCVVCAKVWLQLSKRPKAVPEGMAELPSKMKGYKYLSEAEKKLRHESDQKELRNLKRMNQRLKEKLNSLLKPDEGVPLDEFMDSQRTGMEDDDTD